MDKVEIILESIQLLKMSDEEYFSEKYKDYISNSKLSLLNPEQDGSQEAYEAGFVSKYSESFELGSAIHAIVLQPDYFHISEVFKPNAKLGYFADKVYELLKSGMSLEDAVIKGSQKADYYAKGLSKARKDSAIEACSNYWEEREKWENEFLEKLKSESKQPLYLSTSIFDKFQQCMSGVSKSKFNKILYPEGNVESYNEYAILADIKVTFDEKEVILKIKGKLDNFTIDHDNQIITLNDLKTTGKPVAYFMGNFVKVENQDEKVWYDGSFQKFHYFRQMALYLWLLNAAVYQFRKLSYKCKANMLVIETIPEYKSRVCAVNKKNIEKGLNEFKNLIISVAKQEKNG